MTPTSDDRFEGPLGRRLVENLILVDGCGQPIGHGEKMAVHRGEGMLHLAFSIFIFNARGRLLPERRAVG
ncbi:MAG: isopentenyl-diphosphate delta-isomerase, partial [Planctomycetes bacterium]|nr:isopentenyl-diphosphate delta-isomerase [Planctomycetota bacterium]